jgi:hypothetical protein
MIAPLTAATFGGWGERLPGVNVPPGIEPMSLRQSPAFFQLGDYRVVALGTSQEERLGTDEEALEPPGREQPKQGSAMRSDLLYDFGRADGAAISPGERVLRQLREEPAEEGLTWQEKVDVLDALIHSGSDEEILRRIVLMNRTAFSALSPQDRAAALSRLIEAGPFGGPHAEQVNAAIIELIAATVAVPAELEVLFGVLRERKLLDRLFGRTDKPAFTLFVLLGRGQPLAELTLSELGELWKQSVDRLFTTAGAIDGLYGIWNWLRENGEDLLTLPVVMAAQVGGLKQLTELIIRATVPPTDPAAVKTVTGFAATIGTTLRAAIAGARYVDRLGLRQQSQSPAPQVTIAGVAGGPLLGLVPLYLVSAFLKWQSGLGSSPSRLWQLFYALREVKGLEKLHSSMDGLRRTQRLLRLLASGTSITDELGAVGALRLLPAGYSEALALLAEAMADGSTAAAKAAIRNSAHLAKPLREGLRVAALVERKAAGILVTAEMRTGLDKLLTTSGWSSDQITRLVRQVADADIGNLLTLAGKLEARSVKAIGQAGLRKLAASKDAVELLESAGPGVLDAAYRRYSGDVASVEKLGRILRDKKSNPAEHHKLVAELRGSTPEPTFAALLPSKPEIRRMLAAGVDAYLQSPAQGFGLIAEGAALTYVRLQGQVAEDLNEAVRKVTGKRGHSLLFDIVGSGEITSVKAYGKVDHYLDLFREIVAPKSLKPRLKANVPGAAAEIRTVSDQLVRSGAWPAGLRDVTQAGIEHHLRTKSVMRIPDDQVEPFKALLKTHANAHPDFWGLVKGSPDFDADIDRLMARIKPIGLRLDEIHKINNLVWVKPSVARHPTAAAVDALVDQLAKERLR